MNKSRMKEMSMEVTVGAFIFMVLLALGVFTIILSQDNIFVKNYDIKVRFDDVMGLREGDKVFMRGVDIGKISLIDAGRNDVILTASLKKPIKFTEDYKVEIVAASMLGGKRLVMTPGSESKPEIAEGFILEGLPPKDVISEATDTIAMIRESLEDGKVLENLAMVVEDIKIVAEKISSGEGTLGKLVMDDALYDELNAITANLKNVSERLSAGDSTLGKLLSKDMTMYDDLQASVANLKEISDRLAKGDGVLGKLLSPDDPMQQDLSDAIASIKNITKSIEEGEGSLGKLINDDDLYTEVKLLMVEARAAIDDIRETSPITMFSSIFFGAF